MMNDRLPTHVIVSATIRNAVLQGVYITIIHKGDADRGTLYVLVDDLAGGVNLYQQVFDGDKPALQLHSQGAAAAIAARRAVEIDPDAWVVEVSDRQGRIWFDVAVGAPD
jgi:hypothetical protein